MTNSTGAVVASYTYDGFGNVIASSGSVANTYGFPREQQIAEADHLVYLRARYYSPSYGRFMSRDPIGYRGGLNLYAYVKNNPVRFRDPSGLLGYSPWPGHPPISFPPTPPTEPPSNSPWLPPGHNGKYAPFPGVPPFGFDEGPGDVYNCKLSCTLAEIACMGACGYAGSACPVLGGPCGMLCHSLANKCKELCDKY
ncbi:MAG: RHS repeat-associated core domain-containing protein [Phycisphaerales bacterium]